MHNVIIDPETHAPSSEPKRFIFIFMPLRIRVCATVDPHPGMTPLSEILDLLLLKFRTKSARDKIYPVHIFETYL